MELTNSTKIPAAIFRGVIDEERLFASVVARRTYDVAGGTLRIAAEQTWKVSPGPWDSPCGPMAGDELFYRGGADVFVFGSARAPEGRPAARVDVTVEIPGVMKHTIAVFGDRVWKRRLGKNTPSQPIPFIEMPLTLANAYGGKDEWDELPMPYPDNPDGKGYYLEAANAANRPLPNIEDPRQLIKSWDERPEPVGVCAPPQFFGPKMKRSVEFDPETGLMTKLHPTFFNAAFPGMVAPRLKPGDTVRITGVTADGTAMAFTLPPTDLRVRLGFGDKVSEIEPAVDQIGIDAGRRQVFMTYRYPFRYRLIPLQRRSCELVFAGAAGEAPCIAS